MSSGIKNLKVNPCKVVVYREYLKDGIFNSKGLIDTFYTDSFGNFTTLISLSKPRKNEYYSAELIESKWQLPISGKHTIIAGINNNIGFGIKPKWRHLVTLEDSSGKYKLESYECFNSETKSYRQFEQFDSFPKFGQNFFTTSSPSYSHIFLSLGLRSRNTKEFKEIKKVFDSERYNAIWVKF
jgi:hypothetical protein